MHRSLIFVWLSLSACGARTEPGSSALGEALDGGTDGELPPCVTRDGIRLCGAGCPEIPPPECPGLGCTRARDIHDFSAAQGGVCWADAPDKHSRKCPLCAADELCIQRAVDTVVCTGETVCSTLWARGVRNVCRYLDGTAYDGKGIAMTSTCPTTDRWPYGPCGGKCDACGLAGAFCVGRSSSHPFGICMWPAIGPSQVSDCDPPCGNEANDVCAAMIVPAVDHAWAHRFGVCMSSAECAKLAPKIPGGLTCDAP